MRLANVVTPALERDYLCACLLVQAEEGRVSKSVLGTAMPVGSRTFVQHPRYDKHRTI